MYRKHMHTWLSQSPDGYLWAPPDAPAGGGTAAVAEPPAGGSPAGGAAPAPSGTPGAPAPASSTPAGAAPAGTPQDDRHNWIPPHRLVEETRRRQAIEATAEASRRENESLNQRLRVALGMQTATPGEAEAEAVRQSFFAMFPQYAKLTPEMIDRMVGLAEQGENMAAATTHHWDAHAQRTLRNLETNFLDVLGTDQLTENQRQNLHASFMAMSRRDPEGFRRRYEAEDPALITEFIKEWTDAFVEPVRRLSASGLVQQRRPIPRGGPSAPVSTAPPVIDYSNPQAVEDEAVRRLKEVGLLTQR